MTYEPEERRNGRMKDFPAVVVANYFVQQGKADKKNIDLLKLVKLVYIAHGWHLGLYGLDGQLIREDVEAWKYGPVVRSVYDSFKGGGKRTITHIVTTGMIEEMRRIEDLAGEDTIQFLEKIWKFYREFSGGELSQLTHKKGTPWYQTWHDEEKQSDFGVVISKDKIKTYYERRIQKSSKSE